MEFLLRCFCVKGANQKSMEMRFHARKKVWKRRFHRTASLPSAVASGRPGGRAPLTTAYAPLFRFTQNTFLEHHVTTRQQAIMGNEIITFEHNSHLKFSRFLQNC